LVLLDGIGSSEVNQETEKIVKRVVKETAKEKEHLQENSGIPTLLDEKRSSVIAYPLQFISL